ncbi:hypothetical protein QLQ80_03035 [Mycoplasma sp. M5725]|uniref:Lipoprotein n=1 Tax=Mycoplasma phocimorsus TaxID=3045839 RepID=A0AAJ1PSN4_9MOLU|nr:hypothetical protein [Mycoplasma phocimorsus]MDJ1646038.1 hypothetical protein [Mycoplasma phocimorsus]
MKKIKLILFSSILTLPFSSISCSSLANASSKMIYLMSKKKLENFILNNIELNTKEITIYDALLDLNSVIPLKITNNRNFKKLNINLWFHETTIDYDNEQLLITFYYKLSNRKETSLLKIAKNFFEFKEIDRDDWERIFANLAKISQIEWYEKTDKESGLLKVSNKYATVSKISSRPINLKQVSPDDVLYQLQINNSRKITGESDDKSSNSLLSGGVLLYKKKVPIKFKYPDKEIILESYLNNIKPPSEIPLLDNHIFIGWSTKQDAKQPDAFLSNFNGQFSENTVFYPVFKKRAALIINIPSFEETKLQKQELIIKEELSKNDILNFIHSNLPQPEDKWSYQLDKLQFIDQNQQICDFIFDEKNKLINKFELEHNYTINIHYKHKPVFIYLDSFDNKFLGYQWIENDEKNNLYYTPEINIDFTNFESIGKYPISYFYKDSNEAYKPKTLLKNYVEKENEKIYILINFQQTQKITINTEQLDKQKLSIFDLYLTPQRKLKEKYLPKDIDPTWYKGKYKRQYPNEENNELFDRRSEQEKEIALVFEGWYTDSRFKNKIKFKDGVSTTSINSSFIYPRFALSKWETIQNAREIIDVIFTLVEKSVSAAAEIKEGNDYIIIAEHTIKIIKWILYLMLAGKQTDEAFWKSFDSIADLIVAINKKSEFITFGNKINDVTGKANAIKALFWANKEILRAITGINTIYSKDKFKNSVFINKEVLEGWTAKDIFNKEQNAIFNRNFLGYLIYKTLINSGGSSNSNCNNISGGNNSNTTTQDCYTAWAIGEGKNIAQIIGALVNQNGVQDLIWALKDLIFNSQNKKNSQIALKVIDLAADLGRLIKKVVVNVLEEQKNKNK